MHQDALPILYQEGGQIFIELEQYKGITLTI